MGTAALPRSLWLGPRAPLTFSYLFPCSLFLRLLGSVAFAHRDLGHFSFCVGLASLAWFFPPSPFCSRYLAFFSFSSCCARACSRVAWSPFVLPFQPHGPVFAVCCSSLCSVFLATGAVVSWLSDWRSHGVGGPCSLVTVVATSAFPSPPSHAGCLISSSCFPLGCSPLFPFRVQAPCCAFSRLYSILSTVNVLGLHSLPCHGPSR